jgi:formylglycine-generating enzyme required for sulfatase activity
LYSAHFRIVQNGSPGSYSYATAGDEPDRDNMPVPYVTWGDAARFCNWLQSGQGSAATVSGAYALTETGAYALNGAISAGQLIAVASPAHSGSDAAEYFLPSENEWYKAAYYIGGGTASGYWVYATQSITAPNNTLAPAGIISDNANYTIGATFTDPTNYLTPVGTFSASPSAYGTFDQNGDLFQWNEASTDGLYRGSRGGAFNCGASGLASSYSDQVSPDVAVDYVGFRVATSVAVPEPGSAIMLVALTLVLGLLKLRW